MLLLLPVLLPAPLSHPLKEALPFTAEVQQAPAPLSHLVVPVLLALGWLLGCALMVYIVFS
ncbi:sarcoplasmic/endoplasmic reticulum calcium ATPase regulator DWORF isoform X1 [Manacus candei]|uniref:sarcoplasmic/endoplasmic reticulum calcium ATPase regulator DWORF isoform X1 n=1 Tax=Manacus candei TaxID=415023 RepID=UPI0022280C32|nr:sarcoplasmic/endoplasmic reticulum calcium ATPase regulator DWORF isoform X1 [Manacus candei]